ncbi:hypothetical protein K8R04_03365 [Candidatus Uhrbacteria bacterium]|nr:hypothetical protein [Candidatus Uhrbacteria bacterium]
MALLARFFNALNESGAGEDFLYWATLGDNARSLVGFYREVDRCRFDGWRRGLVRVPDLSSSELISHAKKKLRLASVDPDLNNWDFKRDESQGMYAVEWWDPERLVSDTAVRAHFAEKGFHGNPALLVALALKRSCFDKVTSISEVDRSFPRNHGARCYPCLVSKDENHLEMKLMSQADRRKYGHWSYVAFRKLITF